MQLSSEDLKVVERAARDEKIWRYSRFVELIFWSALVWAGFWLIDQPEFADSELLPRISATMCGMGGAFLGALAFKWHNNQRQLLLRLTSSLQSNE